MHNSVLISVALFIIGILFLNFNKTCCVLSFATGINAKFEISKSQCNIYFQFHGLRLIHRAVRKDSNLPILVFLHSVGCDLNVSTLVKNVTPILAAVRENQIETVKFLIQKGAEVNKGDNGSGGVINNISPLSLAIQLENEEIVQALLKVENIDVNCIDRWNQPLLVSCVRLHPEYVEMLLQASIFCYHAFGWG